MFRRVASTP